VSGHEPKPRKVIGCPTPAADFDDYRAVTLVDVSTERGDAVAPCGSGPSWIVFRDVQLRPAGPELPPDLGVTLKTSREDKGAARVRLCLDDPQGPPLGEVIVPSTGDRYEYAEVTAALRVPPASPVADLYLVMDGALRLDWFRLDVSAAGPATAA